MIIQNLYGSFIEKFEKNGRDLSKVFETDSRLVFLRDLVVEWGENLENVQRWLRSPEYKSHRAVAEDFIREVPKTLDVIEKSFNTELKGELRLSPSMMLFDGFARYDSGHHNVWFGVDHPDADLEYLQALLAHELSHVYRDHQPRVWAHLKKPLIEITRSEYLEAATAQEHLASEGLATLNSQRVYPKIPIHVHHYYSPEEFQWCSDNFSKIDKAIKECLNGDENVWKFYNEDAVAPGSPSRTQYYWAARVLSEWLPKKTGKPLNEAILVAHSWPASQFDILSH